MKKYNYEKDFNRLEQIVQQLEKNDSTLDDSLELFNEAVDLYTKCKKALEEATLQVDELMENIK